MIILPIGAVLNSTPEQNNVRKRKNPTFGMQITKSTQQFVDILTSAVQRHPNEPASIEWLKLKSVIDILGQRQSDYLLLDIAAIHIQKGIEKLKQWQIRLIRLDEEIDGIHPHISGVCDKVSQVIDTASKLLTHEDGTPKHPIELTHQIFRATKSWYESLPKCVTPSPIKQTA